MTTYDFDAPVDRRGTSCVKWDLHYPGWPDATPLFVADMDFRAPPEVVEAMERRLSHGVFGYTIPPEGSYQAVVEWRKARAGQEVRREWIAFSPGVVPSLAAAALAFSKPGDAVVVQPPVYPAFFDVLCHEGRTVARSPLVQGDDGRWRMDFDGIEAHFRDGARLMLLCSPHNPVGRVWTPEELGTLAGLCVRYDATLVSDEIHCDIRRPGTPFTSVATLPGMEGRTLTLASATKTFNLAGLQDSVAICADPDRKRRFEKELHRCGPHGPNLFGMVAQEAAWTRGGPWLDALNAYLAGNIDAALRGIARQDGIRATTPEATYLLWLDCRGLGLPEAELQDFFVRRCGVYPTMGGPYEGPGFVRLNVATRRAVVEDAVGRIAAGVRALAGSSGG